jgi:hypothetical protein
MRQRAVGAAVAGGIVAVGLVATGIVVASRDSGSASPPPVVLGGQGGGKVAAGMAADEAARSSMIAPSYWQPVFEVAGELPALGGEGTAWRFAAGRAPSADDVARLAGQLGVEGDVIALPADQGGGYRVGPDDGSAPTLWVSGSAMGDWYYSGAAVAYPAARCAGVDPAVSGPAEGDAPVGDGSTDAPPPTVDTVCEEPEPPEGVPTKDEAETKARELFASLGYDLDGWTITSWGDEWGAGVSAQRRLDGVVAPLWVGASYGPQGVLTGVNGWLLEPEAVAGYPLVDTAAALERLRSQQPQWFGAYGSDEVLSARADGAAKPASDDTESAVAVPALEPGTVEPAQAESGSGVAVPEPGIVEPAPDVAVEPVPVEPTVITLTGVERSLMQVWSPDGTVWFLPAYAFLDGNGGRWEVLAVAEEFLVAPEPVVTNSTVPATTIPETVPPETTTVDTVPDTAPPSTVVDTVETTTEPSEAAKIVAALVGLSEAEATERATADGMIVRIAGRDGETFPGTADYVETRVNLTIAGGVVVDARVG